MIFAVVAAVVVVVVEAAAVQLSAALPVAAALLLAPVEAHLCFKSLLCPHDVAHITSIASDKSNFS